MTPAMLLPQWQTKTPTRGERAARIGQAGHDLGRGGRGLRDRIGDVLGLAERADHEDALAAGRQRLELVELAEAVAVEGDAEVAGSLLRLARRLQAGGEHHHVVAALVQLAALVLPADEQVIRERILFDVAGPRADELHALVEGALVESVEALALGAHVHEEDLGLALGHVVDGEHRLLVGEHAADAGAVLMLLVARAHALDEGDLLGVRSVRGALDVAGRGTGGAQHALVLERREHIGVALVAVFALGAGVVHVIPRCQHDGADVEVDLRVALAVQQGAGPAGAHALHALGADGALQAALGFGDGLFLRVAVAHFDPAAAALGAGLLGHLDARLRRDLGQGLVVGPGLIERV
jgi:hypothetical protein